MVQKQQFISTDNIKKWTGFTMEKLVKMAENSNKWSKYGHGVDNPQIKDG